MIAAGCDGFGFDLASTLAAATAASAVYRPDAIAALAGAGWSTAELFSYGPSQVVVATSPQVTLVAARGSDERDDWVDNATTCRDVLPEPYGNFSGLTVHRGFLRQAERVRVAVMRELHNRSAPGAAWVFVGHSLGSPVATLLALAACDRIGIPRVDVMSFNGPRWLGADSAKKFDRLTSDLGEYAPVKIQRVVTAHQGILDIVPRVPPARWGWEHCGALTILDKGYRFTGRDARVAWRQKRAEDPVGSLAAWRVLTRLRAGAEAHRWWTLLDLLRSQP